VTFLLDANVFIEAKNLHYGLDFCPAFWEWLIQSNKAKQVYSIEKVGDEIEAGGDELSTWAKDRGASFFLKPDAAVSKAFVEVSDWVTRQNFDLAAVNTFLQVADFYLVAHALAYQCTAIHPH
jgi:Domain of unknown function (DUF4411)